MMFFHEVHSTVLTDVGSHIGMLQHVIPQLRWVMEASVAFIANEIALFVMLGLLFQKEKSKRLSLEPNKTGNFRKIVIVKNIFVVFLL
jgi:hypothetical protein